MDYQNPITATDVHVAATLTPEFIIVVVFGVLMLAAFIFSLVREPNWVISVPTGAALIVAVSMIFSMVQTGSSKGESFNGAIGGVNTEIAASNIEKKYIVSDVDIQRVRGRYLVELTIDGNTRAKFYEYQQNGITHEPFLFKSLAGSPRGAEEIPDPVTFERRTSPEQ